MCAEKTHECGCLVWTASLDLERVFYKVELEAVQESPLAKYLDGVYTATIIKMYADWALYVKLNGNTKSRDVAVRTGVRQGVFSRRSSSSLVNSGNLDFIISTFSGDAPGYSEFDIYICSRKSPTVL